MNYFDAINKNEQDIIDLAEKMKQVRSEIDKYKSYVYDADVQVGLKKKDECFILDLPEEVRLKVEEYTHERLEQYLDEKTNWLNDITEIAKNILQNIPKREVTTLNPPEGE